MAAQKILALACQSLTAHINALLKLRECLNGMLSNGLDLSDKPAQNALQDSHTKIKSRECRFPQKEIAESCIKFEGNIVSLNLKTGKITTT